MDPRFEALFGDAGYASSSDDDPDDYDGYDEYEYESNSD